MRLNSVFWKIQRTLFSFGILLEKLPEPEHVGPLLARLLPFCSPMELKLIGGSEDGAYWVPDDFEGIARLISPGVGPSINFELGVSQLGIPSTLIDPTVSHPDPSNPMLDFLPLRLGPRGHANSISLEQILETTQGELLLQMDIEGAEYQTLALGDSDLTRFRIIVLEIHNLERWLFRDSNSAASFMLDRLLANHTVVYLRANDYRPFLKFRGLILPKAVEVTLLRNDRFEAPPVLAKLDDLPKHGNHLGYVENILSNWTSNQVRGCE